MWPEKRNTKIVCKLLLSKFDNIIDMDFGRNENLGSGCVEFPEGFDGN